MNNPKLCVMVVTLCVLCPIIVGYCWPTSEGTTYSHVVGDGMNITDDIVQNRTVNVFVNNTDVFNNNAYNLGSAPDNSGYGFANEAVTYSYTTSPIPDLTGTYTRFVGTTDEYGQYTVDPTAFYNPVSDWTAIVFYLGGSFDEIDLEYDGEAGSVATWVIYYPNSDIMNYRVYNDGQIFTAPVGKLTWTGGNPYTSYYFYYEIVDTNRYAVISDGFYLTHYTNYWSNSYLNKSIDILLKPSLDTVVTLRPSAENYNVQSNWMYVIVSADGTITLREFTTGGDVLEVILGNLSSYPTLLLNIDYSTQKISLSGIRNLQSFIDDYENAVRYTVSLDWDDPVIFDSMYIYNSSYNMSNEVKWFVPKTVSSALKVPGIYQSFFTFQEYTGGNGQFQFRSVQLWPAGNYFQIKINENLSAAYQETYFGSISIDGVLTFPTYAYDGYIDPIQVTPKEYKLNNLVIAQIDDKVYFNGEEAITPHAAISQCEIGLKDEWLATIYFYPITEVPQSSYGWSIGGFGLDVNGFCMVGLLTSVGSALSAAMYGRRSGIKVGLVLLTAAMCGIIYLTLLMGEL